MCVRVCVCATELRRGTVGLPSPDGAGKQTQRGWQCWPAEPSHSWPCQPPGSPPCPRAGVPAASSLGSATDRRTGTPANLLLFPQLGWRCLLHHHDSSDPNALPTEENVAGARIRIIPPAFHCAQLDRNCLVGSIVPLPGFVVIALSNY